MKNFMKKIKDIKEKPSGNAVLFFGFYFIFFTVLLLILKASSTGGNNYQSYEMGLQYQIDTSRLLANNYSYTYKITIDDNIYLYEGERYSNIERFTYNDLDYYKNNDTFFVDDVIWKKTSNPNDYGGFVNASNIDTIIGKATFDYKTEYESGKKLYSFLISTDTINGIIYDLNSDYGDDPNKIEINMNSDGDIDNITWYLDNYCTSTKICKKSMKIECNYDNYGSIKKIDNPIN